MRILEGVTYILGFVLALVGFTFSFVDPLIGHSTAVAGVLMCGWYYHEWFQLSQKSTWSLPCLFLMISAALMVASFGWYRYDNGMSELAWASAVVAALTTLFAIFTLADRLRFPKPAQC